MRDMFDGRRLSEPLDNHRYPELWWTRVGSLLASK
ncbi:hypothetical protein ETAA8_46120 [Anatilimnocola aggregata]|uniref:Uncharacterized protein n=1 Tax=Anatilimnocola aggregata TaxID=2528021 RepID=A0A517YGY3_9BACT|nr:hypothetical protein ETAA8_46120 [Anatilimnocola aggregata]